MEGSPANPVSESGIYKRDAEPGPPDTEYESKMVMLRAKRKDRIHIVDVVTKLRADADVPTEVTVQQRKTPYYGPKLTLVDDEHRYLLTAPGPDTQLLLWRANEIREGEQYGWEKVAEVTAQFIDDQPQYDLCPECGEPMQTVEHQRKAAFGRCPGPET